MYLRHPFDRHKQIDPELQVDPLAPLTGLQRHLLATQIDVCGGTSLRPRDGQRERDILFRLKLCLRRAVGIGERGFFCQLRKLRTHDGIRGAVEGGTRRIALKGQAPHDTTHFGGVFLEAAHVGAVIVVRAHRAADVGQRQPGQ